MKKALITGICGQDGSYLAELLLQKGYEVYGLEIDYREEKKWRLQENGTISDVQITSGDIADAVCVDTLIKEIQPDECYNYAAISFVGKSWQLPAFTMHRNAEGVAVLLHAIQSFSPHTRFMQPGSSEMFGRPEDGNEKQNEQTLFNPCNPYGVSKLAAYHLVQMYRDAHNVFASNAICYNHESARRGIEYVTRKITDGVAKISLGLENEIRLGNIQTRRDWGSAKDFVWAQWKMLQIDTADDFVLGTGETHSLEELLDISFKEVGIYDWQKYVVKDERFYRPLEPFFLCGDAKKAEEKLAWKREDDFASIIKEMVQADVKRLQV